MSRIKEIRKAWKTYKSWDKIDKVLQANDIDFLLSTIDRLEKELEEAYETIRMWQRTDLRVKQLQAENEELKELVGVYHTRGDAWKDRAEKAETELSEARATIERMKEREVGTGWVNVSADYPEDDFAGIQYKDQPNTAYISIEGAGGHKWQIAKLSEQITTLSAELSEARARLKNCIARCSCGHYHCPICGNQMEVKKDATYSIKSSRPVGEDKNIE